MRTVTVQVLSKCYCKQLEMKIRGIKYLDNDLCTIRLKGNTVYWLLDFERNIDVDKESPSPFWMMEFWTTILSDRYVSQQYLLFVSLYPSVSGMKSIHMPLLWAAVRPVPRVAIFNPSNTTSVAFATNWDQLYKCEVANSSSIEARVRKKTY